MDVGKDNVMHCGKDGCEDGVRDAQMNEVRVFGVKFTLFFRMRPSLSLQQISVKAQGWMKRRNGLQKGLYSD